MNQMTKAIFTIILFAIFATACGKGGGTLCRQKNTTPSYTNNYATAPDNGSGSNGDKDCKQLE